MNRRKCLIGLVALVSICLAWAPHPTHAHAIDSASLTLTELTPGQFTVDFQSGSNVLMREVKEPAQYPQHCTLEGATLNCGSKGLSGSLTFPWLLEGSITRLMVSVRWIDGTRLLRVVAASTPRLTLYSSSGSQGTLDVATDYTWLGIEHIALGFDHLLFVLALALIVRKGRRLFSTVTAFTLAHSLTLVCTALDLVHVQTELVEALIALSVVLVCAECLRSEATLTRRAPWIIAFAFGLLHGLGFASALLDIGLPRGHLFSALLSFNLGVELGQLAVVTAALAVQALPIAPTTVRKQAKIASVYAMGGIAGLWSLERVAAALG